MAGKQLADVVLFEPKKAYQFGEGPRMAATQNGDGQNVYTPLTPQYGAEITYRISPPAAGKGPLKIYVQDASGDTIVSMNGSSAAGLQRVVWNYRGTRKLAVVPPLGPADLRDSVVRVRKTTFVLDSLTKAGWDTAFMRMAHDALSPAPGAPPVQSNINCGGPPAPGVTSPDRPAEGGIVKSNSGFGAGCTMTLNGANIDFEKYQEVQTLINRSINGPVPNNGVVFFGGGGNRGTVNFEASTGDYLVSFSLGGKTYKQVLHVDRVGPNEVRMP